MSPTNFESAGSIESVVWYLRAADYPRSTNRALIDNLFNGLPPFSAEEQIQNRISSNINFLDGTRIAQDARSQFSGAFQKPGNYFSVKLDSGPIHKRDEWSQIITREVNKRMKRSGRYTETLNNIFGQLVLHGIGPVAWSDKQAWCPDMYGMADVLVPSRTLLTMENLSYFALYRRYTAAELWRKTHGPRVDKGWNLPVVERCLKWAATQYGESISSTDRLYNAELWAEDIKSNTGLYASDQVPTINAWDFYFLSDTEKEWGWKRRIVLDCPAPNEMSGGKIAASNKSIIGSKNEFLYNPGARNYASQLSEILHIQFADGSVVAPFRYHSVRSLGFLLYSVCHIQNRLRCKLNDSTFETLLNLFRVANPEDAERLQKVDLQNLGIVPEGLTFVPPQERWQINQNLVQQTMLMNRQSMAENSTSYTKDFGYEQGRKEAEKTATQVSAEVAAATAMVGSMLQKAYGYQEGQYREICRRFCIRNSKDSDVRAARAAILKAGVPEEFLNAEQWEVAAERTIGSGNKQMELAQLNLLMQAIDRFDPDAQRIILHRYTMAAVDDPKLAAELVPVEKNLTTDSVHDAQLSASTMLLGLSMGLKQGVNHGEYSAALLGAMKNTIDKIAATGGVGTPDDLAGLQNLAGQSIDGQPIKGNGVANHIAILAQDKTNNEEVKRLGDVLGKLMNSVKQLAQQLEESQQQEQGANGQLPPSEAVALKAKLMLSETDSKIKEAAAQQKLSHADAKFQQRLQQTQAKDELANAGTIRRSQVEESATDLRTAAEIQRQAQTPDAGQS